jgi:NADH-quinone oxidoreductase subunit G
MPTIQLNGEMIEVREGSNLLLAALQAGEFIPHFCFHPALSSPASCRLCVAEFSAGDSTVMAPSCNQPVVDGMVVSTNTDAVLRARSDVLEFLLRTHPLDCPTCAKAGECELQDHADTHGPQWSDAEWPKRNAPPVRLGPGVSYYSSRCIGCNRCVRFTDEISGGGELSPAFRGQETVVSLFPGRELDDGMAGNNVDICPVGALVEPESRFAPPPWTLLGINSICPGCSSGCNIRVDVNKGGIQRLKPRANLAVNGYWMCDEGRYGWREIQRHDRLAAPHLREDGDQEPVTWEQALEFAARRLPGSDGLSVVLNGSLTNEEAYLLLKLARDAWGAQMVCFAEGRKGPEVTFKSGFRIGEDRTPNRRGVHEIAQALGIELDSERGLLARIDDRTITRAYVVGSDALVESMTTGSSTLDELELLVVQSTIPSSLTQSAHLVIPGLTAFEKEGTFTNFDGRVQRIRRCIEGPPDVLPEWQMLQILAGTATQEQCQQPEDILEEIGREAGGTFSELTYESLQSREQDERVVGQAYGAGWSDRLQQWGFLHVDDHRK